MNVFEKDGNLIFDGIRDFDLFEILDSGQFFRFKRIDDKLSFCAGDKMFLARQDGDRVTFYNTGKSEYDFLYNFFDLVTDYSMIKECYLKLDDKNITNAISYAGGIRILNQDAFEMLISFIISQNNRIPRIKNIIELLCENFGEKKSNKNGEYYSFPTADRLSKCTIDDLAVIRSGFRAKYIVDAVQKYVNGDIDVYALHTLPYETAQAQLETIKGVGAKVANCVLLFGCGFHCAFPVDVWVKKVIAELYGGNFDRERFNGTEGIAQQYLFYYMRKK